jgi:molecular chaperone GrpE (heat shock protein)
MPEQAPITTATATVKVVVDRTEYDRFKADLERDFAALKEEFAGVFKVRLDDLTDKLMSILDRFDKAAGGGDKDKPESGPERTKAEPDQSLAKLTIIVENTERTAKAVEEMNEREQQ